MTPTKFLDLFSAFEFALIRSKFRRSERGPARADWIGFSEIILGDGFYKRVLKESIAPTLTTEPPRRFMNEADGVRWEESGAPVHDVTSLVRAVGQVRHNLIHGNKYLGGDNERDRSDALIRDAANILIAAVEACPNDLVALIRSRI